MYEFPKKGKHVKHFRMNKYLINQFRQFSFSELVKCINRMDTISFAE